MQAGYRVIAVDLRGFGWTEMTPDLVSDIKQFTWVTRNDAALHAHTPTHTIHDKLCAVSSVSPRIFVPFWTILATIRVCGRVRVGVMCGISKACVVLLCVDVL